MAGIRVADGDRGAIEADCVRRRIGRDVWAGGGAIILPGVSTGDGALIGAGSVVTRDVAAGATVFGNPARVRG